MEAVFLYERNLNEIMVRTCAEQVILTSVLKCSRLIELSMGSLVKKATDPLLGGSSVKRCTLLRKTRCFQIK